MKDKIHYVHPYIINPGEALSVFLIGGGGTGSHVLSGLAAINKSLLALDHAGIDVTLFDDDTISETNVGRQLFFESDIGQNKANVLISRINRSFGFDWKAEPVKYDRNFQTNGKYTSNIVISCVDSVEARREIEFSIKHFLTTARRSYDEAKHFYWIDCGNSAHSGQIFIGTNGDIPQPHSKNFETVKDFGSAFYPFSHISALDMEKEKNLPSCSMQEALMKQDLFVNKMIATHCCHILWTMLREHRLTHKGVYVNLSNLTSNPINL